MSKSLAIDLFCSEPGDVDRRAFPLTAGLPFARGVLTPGEPVALEDAAGNRLSLQTRVMEQHDDGSVRWLLLDFSGDFEAMQQSRFRLLLNTTGPDAADGGAITTTEQGDRLVIATGVLQLEVDRRRCLPLGRIVHQGAPVSEGGLDFFVTADSGAQFAARHDDAVTFEIEEQGPLRSVFLWKGTHRDERGAGHFDFELRLTVYAGKPFVRVEHVLINRLDPAVTNIKQVVARLPIGIGAEPQYSVGGWPYHFQEPHGPFESPVRIEQYQINGFRVIPEGAEAIDGNGNCQGWVGVSGSDHSVLIAPHAFWQNFPKAIAARGDEIRYELIPDRGHGFDVPRGMAKTHAFLLCFVQGRATTGQMHDTAFALQRWPMPAADSTYYASSGEFWEFFPYFPKQYPRLEIGLQNLVEDFGAIFCGGQPPTARGRAYGLKHYGDFAYDPKRMGYTDVDWESPDRHFINNAYDTPFIMALYFLRYHIAYHFWEAEAQALHMMDIDTCHRGMAAPDYPDTERMLGAAYPGADQHITNVPASGMQHFSQGLMLYHHLTGDPRALQTAIGYADFLAYAAHRHKWGMARNAGWSLTTLGTVYPIAPKDEYVKGADALLTSIERDLKIQHGALDGPDGHLRSRVASDRGINLCQRGLIVWHQATGDERTRRLIVALADLFLDLSVGAEGVPVMGNWPEHVKPFQASQGFAGLDAMAYAYRLTGERRYVDAGVGQLAKAVEWINTYEDTGDGETFARPLRGMFPFMTVAHELGILEKIPGAGRWLNE